MFIYTGLDDPARVFVEAVDMTLTPIKPDASGTTGAPVTTGSPLMTDASNDRSSRNIRHVRQTCSYQLRSRYRPSEPDTIYFRHISV